MTTRTRFAPSPTGYLHVGNVRSALFGWLFAKSTGGSFVVRIEDTDQDRSLPEYTEMLLDDLDWLGIAGDEDPRKGGPYAPYKQTERADTYKIYTDKLLASGHAFHCYCTEEEIDAERAKCEAEGLPPQYQGRCRNLSPEEILAFQNEGRIPTIRLKAFNEDFILDDLIKGKVVFPKGMVGDFVIVRSNGIPVYNYAVAIDDITMKMTHVLRADEHLSNTVRQQMIYKALGEPEPRFGHMAVVTGEDHKKLSKRHGATSVEEFRRLGYLPEALCNMLAFLGWSNPEGEDILSMDELVRLFSIERVSPSPSMFDFKRLNWISQQHIIKADIDHITNLSIPYISDAGYDTSNFDYVKSVVDIVRGSCSHLSQITDHIDFFFKEDYAVDEIAQTTINQEDSKNVIKAFHLKLTEENRPINKEVYSEIITHVKEAVGLNGKKLFMPIRAALTGKEHGPEMFLILPIIGKDKALSRLSRCL
ncbi:MAG: glutamate--tRNA ligase [Brevinema sp.]